MENTHQQYSWVITANPLTHIIEAFKYGFLGEGSFSWGGLTYSLIFTCIVLFLGCISFNRVQRSFMDVI
jgi:lipopolysaccharide transport system permease protein